MHGRYIPRLLEEAAIRDLGAFPAVAILGPRQCGKTTLAKRILSRWPESAYLDLELPSDVRKLSEPELFFDLHQRHLVCLDEIRRRPVLSPVMRSMIDLDRRNGRFLILGSASPELLRQSSETLAGRIAHLELTPFLLPEIDSKGRALTAVWFRGGYPESLLASSDQESLRWRQNFIRTFLERDIPALGSYRIAPVAIERLWKMCAHSHGQLFNQSQLGESLGISHTTVRSYIDLLQGAFMLRVLQPLQPNLKKRLVKTPRVYVRDSGILHALLDIATRDDLLGHPARGPSWEGLIVESVIGLMPGWRSSFYRTATGTEVDLVIERGRRRIAIECKASTAPALSKGFWQALGDLEIHEAWVVAPVKESYPIAKGVVVAPPADLVRRCRELASGKP